MNPETTINRLASGEALTILATCVVALSIAVVLLFRRLNAVHDKRIEDLREMGREMARLQNDANLALSALTAPLQEAVRELRGRK